MSLLNQQGYWQRHYVIQQSLSALAELELKFPKAAEMAKLFKIHEHDSAYVCDDGESIEELFKGIFSASHLTPEEEAENQSWRDFIKGVCAIAGQAFYASRDVTETLGRESREATALRQHGEYIIHNIIGDYWRSFQRIGRFWIYDARLKELVEKIVDQQASLDADLLTTEMPNA